MGQLYSSTDAATGWKNFPFYFIRFLYGQWPIDSSLLIAVYGLQTADITFWSDWFTLISSYPTESPQRIIIDAWKISMLQDLIGTNCP